MNPRPLLLASLAFASLIGGSAFAQTNTYPFPSSGSVGIGTTAPTQTLDVEGSIRAGGRARLETVRAIGGSEGDTVAIGSFSNDGHGKNVRIYLKAHNGGVIDLLTYEINEVAYIGPSTNWLEIPLNQGGVSYIGTPAYAIDIYRQNINSTSDPLFVRVRVKRAIGGGNIQLVIDYDDDATFTPSAAQSTLGTGFNASTSPAGGPVDGYYGAVEWMFPVSSGQGWANANSRGLFVTNSGNVGVGTVSPQSLLAVSQNTPGRVELQIGNTFANPSAGASVAVSFRGWRDVNPNQENARIESVFSDGAGNNLATRGDLRFLTTTTYNELTEKLRISNDGNVGIGTTNPTHKLAVNGTIKAKEVIVETTGWSDYVFAEDYALAPLAEVEAHIKEHKHLPGIPSAVQVANQGVSVGDMQARLLAKVEELTLYIIDIKKENTSLRQRLEVLENK
jgi:hypothetical protein